VTANELFGLQQTLLVSDGILAIMSTMIAIYWWQTDRAYPRIFSSIVFYTTLSVVAICLTISDIIVIGGIQSWASLPIVRGLVFRLPLAIVTAWMVFRMYIFKRTK